MRYLLFLAGLAFTCGLVIRHRRKQAHEDLYEEARLNRLRLFGLLGDS